MMTTTSILMQEHKVILNVLDKIEHTIADESNIADSIDQLEFYFNFITEYSDELHHKKEEDIYFEWISKNHQGLKNGPIACMLKEHESLRSLKKSALKNKNLFIETKEIVYLRQMKSDLTEFIGILRAHIDKEDTILYKMAEDLNSTIKDGDNQMLAKFEKVQTDLAHIINKYNELA